MGKKIAIPFLVPRKMINFHLNTGGHWFLTKDCGKGM
jgi:hypothetical protein